MMVPFPKLNVEMWLPGTKAGAFSLREQTEKKTQAMKQQLKARSHEEMTMRK